MTNILIHASSLPDLFDCPARWAAKNIEKRFMPSSPSAQLGTAVHAGTAFFDDMALRGTPVSIDDTVGAVVDALHDESRDVDWGGMSPRRSWSQWPRPWSASTAKRSPRR